MLKHYFGCEIISCILSAREDVLVFSYCENIRGCNEMTNIWTNIFIVKQFIKRTFISIQYNCPQFYFPVVLNIKYRVGK